MEYNEDDVLKRNFVDDRTICSFLLYFIFLSSYYMAVALVVDIDWLGNCGMAAVVAAVVWYNLHSFFHQNPEMVASANLFTRWY